MNNDQQLKAILSKVGLEASFDAFWNYLLLLEKWNKSFNLTAIRDVDEMITRHIADSLAILSFINGEHLIDVGSGAGLPGIPVALALPTTKVTLMDSNGKKINFLREVKRQLQIENLNIVHSRVENFIPEQKFDTVMTRAFSKISKMIDCTKHLIAEDGIWLAMKGPNLEQELSTISYPFEVKSYYLEAHKIPHACVIISQLECQ